MFFFNVHGVMLTVKKQGRNVKNTALAWQEANFITHFSHPRSQQVDSKASSTAAEKRLRAPVSSGVQGAEGFSLLPVFASV